MQNTIWNLISIAIGALITWLVTRCYYVRAALALKSEAQKIRKLLGIVLQALEDAKMVKLNRDASGQIIGMTYNLKVDSAVQFTTSQNVTLNEVKKEQNSK
jgi:hypothetical protein